jgi:hypothetical protein
LIIKVLKYLLGLFFLLLFFFPCEGGGLLDIQLTQNRKIISGRFRGCPPPPFAGNLPSTVNKTQDLRPKICEIFAISPPPLFEISGSVTDYHVTLGLTRPMRAKLELQQVNKWTWYPMYPGHWYINVASWLSHCLLFYVPFEGYFTYGNIISEESFSRDCHANRDLCRDMVWWNFGFLFHPREPFIQSSLMTITFY